MSRLVIPDSPRIRGESKELRVISLDLSRRSACERRRYDAEHTAAADENAFQYNRGMAVSHSAPSTDGEAGPMHTPTRSIVIFLVAAFIAAIVVSRQE